MLPPALRCQPGCPSTPDPIRCCDKPPLVVSADPPYHNRGHDVLVICFLMTVSERWSSVLTISTASRCLPWPLLPAQVGQSVVFRVMRTCSRVASSRMAARFATLAVSTHEAVANRSWRRPAPNAAATAVQNFLIRPAHGHHKAVIDASASGLFVQKQTCQTLCTSVFFPLLINIWQ